MPAAAITAAGLLAAGTAAGLAGTGSMNRQGMIAIPALHDAASDRPVPFTPVCSHTAIPVCLNPAFASYLPVTLAALQPVLSQLAGLPGAWPGSARRPRFITRKQATGLLSAWLGRRSPAGHWSTGCCCPTSWTDPR